MSDPDRSAYEQRRDSARLDLRELAGQVDAGEIDEVTAARLRAGYERELTQAEAALGALEVPQLGSHDAGTSRSMRRAAVGTVALIGAFTVALLFIGGDTIPSQQGAAEGIDATPRAAPETSGSLETMEQVVAANPTNVELRLAVANAYFQRQEYSPSLSHYLAVLEFDATAQQESIALARVGWMAYITGQLDAADEYLRRSLDVDPGNIEGKLFLGYVRYLGFDDAAGAVPLLEEVLSFSGLAPDLRAEVERVLATARQEVGTR